MGDRLGRGCYVVTHVKSKGGSQLFDVCRILRGYGISADPWVVLSLLNGSEYKVSAIEIVKESYHSSSCLDEAKAIYVIHTGRVADLPKPPEPDCPSAHFP